MFGPSTWPGDAAQQTAGAARRPEGSAPRPGSAARPGSPGSTARTADRAALATLVERTRPTSWSGSRLLPVHPALAELLPEPGLRRGTTLVVTGLGGDGGQAGGGPVRGDEPATGEASLALALVAAASGAGSWCAVIGLPHLGAVAAHGIGLDLARLALVPHPGPAWGDAAAAAVDGVDLVVLRPPFSPRPAMARRLAARAKERRAVLVVVPGRAGWPEGPDVRLSITGLRWDGIGAGDGYLRRRQVTVTVTGRRSATRARHGHLWLPGTSGAVEAGRGLSVGDPTVGSLTAGDLSLIGGLSPVGQEAG